MLSQSGNDCLSRKALKESLHRDLAGSEAKVARARVGPCIIALLSMCIYAISSYAPTLAHSALSSSHAHPCLMLMPSQADLDVIQTKLAAAAETCKAVRQVQQAIVDEAQGEVGLMAAYETQPAFSP